MLRKILIALLVIAVLAAAALWLALRPDPARLSNAELTGRVPVLSGVREQTLPTVSVAEAVGWPAGAAPTPAPGLRVARFAAGLDHPRQMLVLPNGDVLVAESAAPAKKDAGGIRGWIEKRIMAKAGAVVPSANRITRLRDADGDGVAEVRTPYITGLNSPYGMALVGSTLYVANTDALLAFDYDPAAPRITAPGRKIVDLPAYGSNQHWTKSLAAGPDGILYVGVGSNSNIANQGMEWERGRALVLEVRPASRYKRTFASGLRNPSGLATHPVTGAIWASVNERDMLGSDMVPDYLTRVDFGANYGWPWYYWGGFIDPRVEGAPTDGGQYVRRPEYALGVHVAPLGLSFATSPALGSPWTNGVFVALHGSWNRSPVAGYKVIFVPFGTNGRPLDALPIDILSGFVNEAGEAMGRPADARQASDGALLVADDVGDVIWRVSQS